MDTGQQAGKASHLFLSTGRVDVEIKELRDLQQVGDFLRIHQILGKLTDINSCETKNAEADTPNRTKTHLEETVLDPKIHLSLTMRCCHFACLALNFPH